MSKREKRTARLWEDTVVVALRDMQWQTVHNANAKAVKALAAYLQSDASDPAPLLGKLQRLFRAEVAPTLESSVVPPGFVKLDGNAEGRTADLALANSKGRCFLIEVKSERERIVDEWRATKKKKKQASKSKSAFRRLKELVDSHNDGSDQTKLLRMSLLGHHFAYWAKVEEPDDQGGVRGGVFIEPYILACANTSALTEGLAKRSMAKPGQTSAHFCGNNGQARKQPWRLPASALLDGQSQMQISLRAEEATLQQVGLGLESFTSYVRWLCEGSEAGGVEPINCVVLTTDGFFQILSDTSQLAALVAAPSASLGRNPKVSQSRPA